jgi:DNA repair photolyase
MGKAPAIEERISAMEKISEKGVTTFVTCEPIMDFDVDDLTSLVLRCHPQQVNIGRNSWPEVSIPEPTNEKVAEFISKLTPSAHVKLKKNIWEYNQESVKEYFVTKPNTLF